MGEEGSDPAWIAIDASKRGQIRFATVTPGDVPVPGRVRSYDATLFPTFTDGLLRYQRDENISLRQRRSVIVIAGATAGENIAISRSRWTISRSGLRAMLEREPIILNDTGARAWASLSGATQHVDAVKGHGYAGLATRGRHAFLHLEEGLGTAIVDVDDAGATRIVETEAGHLDCPDATGGPPVSTAPKADGPLSWEKALMSDHPHRSALLGRFVANLMLASGAWNGVVLSGSGAAQILSNGQQRSTFANTFSEPRPFRRVLDAVPICLIEQKDPILLGAAAMIARRDHAPA